MPPLSEADRERIFTGRTKARLCYNQEDLGKQAIQLVQDDFLSRVRDLGLVRLEGGYHPLQDLSHQEIKASLERAFEGLAFHENIEYYEKLVRSCPLPVPYSYWNPLRHQLTKLDRKAIEIDSSILRPRDCR